MASSPNFNRLLHDGRPNITIIFISCSSIIISINRPAEASSFNIDIIIIAHRPNSNCLLDDERVNTFAFSLKFTQMSQQYPYNVLLCGFNNISKISNDILIIKQLPESSIFIPLHRFYCSALDVLKPWFRRIVFEYFGNISMKL